MTMDSKRLWAKSKRHDENERHSMFLPGHLQDVYEAAKRVVEATGDDQLRALGLEPDQYRDRFRRCVLLAAAVHDLGKANDHFQGMLLKLPARRDKPQGLRHEWVTLLMLQTLKPWLLPYLGSETDFAFVEWAVSGHHPGHNHASPPKSCPSGAGVELVPCTNRKEFLDALKWLGETFRLNGDPPLMSTKAIPLVEGNNAFQQLEKWSREARKFWERIKNTPEAKLHAAIKNSLVAADVAGSALPKHGPPDWDKITMALRCIPPGEDLEFLAQYGLEGFQPHDFQKEVAGHSADVVVVKAGCGTGKTVAAYMRAANKWKGRRLYFCYPTTGTATEGFKDYLFPEQPDKDDTSKAKDERKRLEQINAELFHSRSEVDYEIILGTGGDTGSTELDAAMRADALEAWSTPVVACTVDTVLGLVQNNKKGLFSWPALAQSAFVFDEIHAYDDRLFGALLRFLRDLPGIPSLLMTASLPKPREEALREVLKDARGIELMTPIQGPKNLEELPRYHKHTVNDNSELMNLIADEVKRGGKVLWVSNTVNRVIASAEAATAAGLEPKIYHSRFKYKDRVDRHKAVVNAFDPKVTDGVLACTSQVCEMSLDLKGCTLLVTETAPVPALIQRLGRLNRHAKNGDPTRPFVVIETESYAPYVVDPQGNPNPENWPTELQEWLNCLPCDGAAISQRMLADAWKPDLSEWDYHKEMHSAWLDDGPVTKEVPLREASPGITVLMRSDVAKIDTSKELGKYTLPMPPPPKGVDWRTENHKGIPVVEDATIDYDKMRGAKWQK